MKPLNDRIDDLTGLANRSYLIEAITDAVARVQAPQQIAFLLLDLDNFREVNEALGHDIGDVVLEDVAGRLRDNFGERSMVISRLGGDEFALVFAVNDEAEALALGKRLKQVLATPYVHDDEHLVDVDASIGICLGPEHGSTGGELFGHADTAMYRARKDKSGLGMYDPTSDRHAVSRVGIVGSLRRALQDNELYLEYQPKISLSTRRIVGVEALVRWRHPSGQTVPPDEFIPAAERSGLMPQLTDAILDMAMDDVRGWRRSGFEVPVAVNVTATDLLEPNFVENLAAKLKEHRIPASHLTLEVTERVLADDLARARSVMVSLNKLGVKMAMDDFGTGWSSLLMLRSLPVSEVKLDRSFVSRAVDSEMDQAIVAKVTELCHALELVVVAEGVETEQVLDRLIRLGCDEAQGWFVATPMSPDEVILWSARYLEEQGLTPLGVPRQGPKIAAASAAATLASLADPTFALPLPSVESLVDRDSIVRRRSASADVTCDSGSVGTEH